MNVSSSSSIQLTPAATSSTSEVRQPTIETIPTDVVRHVLLKFLNREEMIPLSFVSKRFSALCKERPSEIKHINLLEKALGNAAGDSYIDLIDWYLTKLRCPQHIAVTNGAASKGNVVMLQWLKEKDYPMDRSSCVAAARGGHLVALEWLQAQGCPVGVDTLVALEAAGGRECREAEEKLAEDIFKEWT